MNRATRRSRRFHRPISRPERKPGAGDVAGSTLTGEGDREMLTAMALATILAVGGLLITIIAISAFALLAMAVYAFWKMRSDDFWEEQD